MCRHQRLDAKISQAVCLIVILVVWPATIPAAAKPLRYAPKPDSVTAYEVEIRCELPDRIAHYKGTIWYETTAVEPMLKMTCRGTLSLQPMTEEDRKKFSGRARRGDGLHGTFWAVTRHSFPVNTDSLLTVTQLGEVRARENQCQLPFLLGNLSDLMFEQVSEAEQKSWNNKHDVAIWERLSSPSPFPFMRYGRDQTKATRGTESASFTFDKSKGELDTFTKAYRLHASSDEEEFTLEGKGQWTFHRGLGMSESLDFAGQIVMKEHQIVVTLPVTVKYRRLSDAEWATFDKEWKEKQEELKEKAKQMFAERNAPLEGAKREEVLANLRSKDAEVLMDTLSDLAARSESLPDEEIANAIRRHFSHRNIVIRKSAQKAMKQFSPAFAREHELNESYHEGREVTEVGPVITADTPLGVGLIVVTRWHNRWHAAKVMRILPDELVEVEVIKWNKLQTRHRSQLRLAPPEVNQPYVRTMQHLVQPTAPVVTPDAGGSPRDYRTWTDDSGTFAIVAKYAGADADNVRLLRKQDGKEISVPLARLSATDRQLAEQLRDAPPPSNPFDP